MSDTPDLPPDTRDRDEQMFRSHPQPMWIYDVDSLAFLDVNEATVARYGWSRDEFLRMNLVDIRPPQTVAVLRDAVREAKAKQRIAQSGPWHHRTKAGDSLFIRASSHGIRFNDRDARLVVATDITQQLALEAEREAMIAALRKSQERLDAAIAGGDVGLWERHLIARTLSCGGRWAEILGTTPEVHGPVTPASFDALCHPEDLPRSVRHALDYLRDPSSPYQDEFRMRHTSGQWIWVLSRGRIAEYADDGRPARMVGTFVDITALKAAQAAQEQRRAAEQASAMKSQFLARVSHELRTPLNAVLGFSQLLQLDPQSPLSPSQRERVTYIEQAGQHLLDLITDLMDLSRIEVDALDLQPSAVDVAALVEDCLRMVDTPLRERGLRVERHVPPQVPQAWADRLRLRQCVLNLLSNAIKYNIAGGTVRIAFATAPDAMLTLSVWNTGDGLGPSQLLHLYEPFNRLGRDGGPEAGTGIGLAITRQLVERMGGRIDAAGEPGRWALFSLTLPASRETP